MSSPPEGGPCGALYVHRRRPASAAPWAYLVRRPERSAPTALVIALVTLLLVVAITPSNTFRSTLDANLAALRVLTLVAPAQRPGFDERLREILDGNGFQERWTLVEANWVRYPALIGEGSCPLILGRPDEAPALLARLGLDLVSGRLPSGDHAAIVLHEDVARARGLRIGSRIGSLANPDDAIPGAFEVVGLLRGRTRAAVGVVGHGVLTSMLRERMPLFALIYPRAGRKAESDGYLHAARDGTGPAFEVIDEDYARRRADRALRNLPLLVRFVSISSAAVAASIVTLLTFLTFQSRVPEFAVQIAIGVDRDTILRPLVLELSIIAFTSWVVGAAMGLAGLSLYDAIALRPRGILMHAWDPPVLLATAAVPLLVVGTGVAALNHALRRIDPITAILRRAV